MQLSAIVLARVLGYIETVDLNPQGKVFFPELIKGIIETFQFQKYPQTFDETNEEKGVNFHGGTWNGVNVDKLTIFPGVIIVDTRTSTADSERILHEGLAWAAEAFGLVYKPAMIRRKKYVSDLTFYSDAALLVASDAIRNLQGGISMAVTGIFNEEITYVSQRLDLDFDKSQRPIPTAPFSIQRRTDTPFSENKYFSEAPLPTDIHIQLLEKFEVDISGPAMPVAETFPQSRAKIGK